MFMDIPHKHSRYSLNCIYGIFTKHCDIVPLHNTLTKVGLEDARDVRLLLSANQSERSFQSEFSAFHFNEEHFFYRNERSSVIGFI